MLEREGADLVALAGELSAGWDPRWLELIATSDPGAAVALSIRTADPVPAWTPSTVTMIGDAIHTMTPGRGAGANTALRDARELRDRLVRVRDGELGLVEAVGEYEDLMRRYSSLAVRESLEFMNDNGTARRPVIGPLSVLAQRTGDAPGRPHPARQAPHGSRLPEGAGLRARLRARGHVSDPGRPDDPDHSRAEHQREGSRVDLAAVPGHVGEWDGQAQPGSAAGQRGEHCSDLQPGQRRAQAVVRAAPEAQVRAAPSGTQRLGVVEAGRVVVRRLDPQEHLLARRDRDAAELEVLLGPAREDLDTQAPDELVDEALDLGPGGEPGQGVGAQQVEHGDREPAPHRDHPRRQQRADEGDQLAVAQTPVVGVVHRDEGTEEILAGVARGRPRRARR